MRSRNILKTLLTIAITALISGSAASALINSSKTVPCTGILKTVGVGVYWDSACTNPVSSINWGMLDPGSGKSYGMYVKNSGNVAVVLSISVGNWNPPSASNYLTLSWNRTNYVLDGGSTVTALVILSAASDTGGITDFSFEFTITGTEKPS